MPCCDKAYRNEVRSLGAHVRIKHDGDPPHGLKGFESQDAAEAYITQRGGTPVKRTEKSRKRVRVFVVFLRACVSVCVCVVCCVWEGEALLFEGTQRHSRRSKTNSSAPPHTLDQHAQ